MFTADDNVLAQEMNNIKENTEAVQMNLRVGRSAFDSRQGLGIFLFATASRPALGTNQPLIHWVLGVLSSGVKRPGREADHSHIASKLIIHVR
jgi:hypothetical protein